MKTLHRISLIIIALSVALVALGGVVHNTGSSLACPDWPLCFNQVFPKMEGGVAIEHSHRLLAALVGFLTLALVALATRLRSWSPLLFRLSLLALGIVIFQGVLGGITVLLRLSVLASTAHLAVSQIFLATLLYIALKSRASDSPVYKLAPPVGRPVITALRAASVFIFLQIVLGAFVRHSGASVACGLGSSSTWLCVDPASEKLTWWPANLPAQIGMLHRYIGFAAMFAVVAGTLPLLRWARIHKLAQFRKLAIASHVLVLTQIALGLLALAQYLNPVLVTMHLVVAMALWAVLLSAAVLANEHRRANSRAARPAATSQTGPQGEPPDGSRARGRWTPAGGNS